LHALQGTDAWQQSGTFCAGQLLRRCVSSPADKLLRMFKQNDFDLTAVTLRLAVCRRLASHSCGLHG